MRRIDRAELDASVRLVRDGEGATDELEEKWRADPDNFDPEINNDIYGSVKDTLFQMQYAKCCYCETVIDAGFPGDVEHFRPKKEVIEDRTHPGYWWLAYDWPNLLLSCNRCNRAFKKNHFPLSPSGTRARERAHDLDEEDPLLIDPVRDEPGEHIVYREHMLVGKTEKGKRTIELLGLNREPGRIEDVETGHKLTDGLRGARERHYNKLKDLYTRLDRLLKALDGLRTQLENLPDEVRSHLMEVEETAHSEWNALLVYIQDLQEPYLAMSVAALEANFALSFDL